MAGEAGVAAEEAARAGRDVTRRAGWGTGAPGEAVEAADAIVGAESEATGGQVGMQGPAGAAGLPGGV